jgi:excisionase family DNA binding protein
MDQDELMTRDELIGYLKLDAEAGDVAERVRNLIRRHGLPVLRCGRLQRFRRSHVDAWLAGERFGNKTLRPARSREPKVAAS